ncbi:MAG TPA: hypothetical protein VND19_02195 [Acetobacteraceae bacterium]|nr:hypothetical protein [Acetobacteraceae bacterium]
MLAEPGPLQRFVAELLTAEGALIEPIEPEGLDAVVPPSLQQALGVPELCRLGFGTALPEAAARVGIESDWLERCARVMGERGRWTKVMLDASAGLGDAEAALAHELALDNATFRLVAARPAWTRYLLFDLRYTAISDEKRDGVLRCIVNLATGALPDAVLERITPWLDDAGTDAVPPDSSMLPPDWPRSRVLDVLRHAVPPRLAEALAQFERGLRRRLARDQDRLHAYHNDLYREAMRRAAGAAEGDPVHQREQLRIAAIGREYRAKLDDLGHKYALRVALDWTRTLELVMPVVRLEVLVRRRKADRTVWLDWNRLARRLESPPCEDSFGPERPRLACDDAVHLVSAAGLAACPGCGKPYCRACHPGGCPKCGRA